MDKSTLDRRDTDDDRLGSIEVALLECIGGDLLARMPISTAGDELDAISTGINILLDELGHILEEQKSQTQQLEATRLALQQDLNATVVKLAQNTAVTAGELRRAYNVIAQTVATEMGVDRCSIWFYHDDRSCIRCVELYSRPVDEHSQGMSLSARDFPAYFAALATERIISADDAHSDPQTSEFSAPYLTPLGITAMLDAPIRVRGELIGVICIEHVGSQRSWSLAEQSFAGAIGDLIAQTSETAELVASQHALAQAQSLAHLGNWELSLTDGDWQCSDELRRIFGHGPTEGFSQPASLCGDEQIVPPFVNQIHPDDRNAFNKALESTQNGSDVIQLEHRIMSASGATRFVSSHLNGVVADTGKVVGIRGTTQDITELALMRKEQAARHSAEQANQALIRSQAALRRTLADLAHDVRTPLASVKLGVGRLPADHPEASRIAETLAREVEYLDALFANFLSLVQLDGEVLEFNLRPLDLSLLLKGLLTRFELLAQDRSIELNLALSEKPIVAEVDSTALEQAIANLLSNAVKHAKKNIAVQLYTDARQAVITVRDDGPGIPDDEVALLKQRYFRGQSKDTPNRPGVGLGLTIADSVIQRHAGTLTISSHAEGGALAEVRLPWSNRELPKSETNPGQGSLTAHVISAGADVGQ
jgi:signal transduction histidine kinase/GAF domain-containing protein